jgi:23S rRNA (adenine-N6)-dimethyltransferase
VSPQRRTDRDMLRRTLSQNFLRPTGADQFVGLTPADATSLAIEVGAGEGVLTERLAHRYEHVISYEVDEHVAARLAKRVRRLPNVQVVVADFLASRPPEEPFEIVGNVPFSLTSPIIDWCLRARDLTKATIITQLEYAKKRTGTYGRWSLLTIQTWPEFDWTLLGQISRRQFRPVPRVDAGVMRLTQRDRPLVPPARLGDYRHIVELGFGGVGGSLYASLNRQYSTRLLDGAFRDAGLDRSTIVAFVEPDQWIELFHSLEMSRAAEPHRRSGRRGR